MMYQSDINQKHQCEQHSLMLYWSLLNHGAVLIISEHNFYAFVLLITFYRILTG